MKRRYQFTIRTLFGFVLMVALVAGLLRLDMLPVPIVLCMAGALVGSFGCCRPLIALWGGATGATLTWAAFLTTDVAMGDRLMGGWAGLPGVVVLTAPFPIIGGAGVGIVSCFINRVLARFED